MAKSKAAPIAATDEGRRSRTIYVSDDEWAEIEAAADKEGRKPSRHIVIAVRERAAKA